MPELFILEGASSFEYSRDNTPGSFRPLPSGKEALKVERGTAVTFGATGSFQPVRSIKLVTSDAAALFALNPIPAVGTYLLSGTPNALYKIYTLSQTQGSPVDDDSTQVGETMTGNIKVTLGGSQEE